MSIKKDLHEDSNGTEQYEQRTLDDKTTGADSEEASSSEGAKVHRIIQKHGLNGLGQEFKQKYTSQRKRWSLRDLEEKFNLRVLDHSTRKANIDEEEYRDCVHRLQSDNLELTEERLDLLGVDGKEVLNDMVTHETIRLYLKNFHDATASNQFASASESADTIEQIHHRLRQILNSTLERHHRHGELPADPEIDSMVGVICPDCGVTVDAVKYLQLRTCPNCL